MTSRLMAFLCGLVLMPAGASAQVTLDGCRDARGIAVASIRDVTLNDVANASVANGIPIVRYNPNVLRQMSDVTRLFTYGHECAHHALGHALGAFSWDRELQADCWSIRTLTERGYIGEHDVRVIQTEVARMAGGDPRFYPPGDKRAAMLGQCAVFGGRATVARQSVELEFGTWPRGGAVMAVQIDGRTVGRLDNMDSTDWLRLGGLTPGRHEFVLSDIRLYDSLGNLLDRGGFCRNVFDVVSGQDEYDLTLRAYPGRGYQCSIR